MEGLVVLKLGGSVITDKDKPSTPRKPAIKKLAKAVAEALKQKPFPLVIVHGAGSFGHTLVKQYKINEGVGTPQQKLAFADVHASVARLSGMVCEALIAEGIPAVSIPPVATADSEAKRLRFLEFNKVKALIDAGYVPVLHGDMVLDRYLGGSVCSGDQIVPFLANRLGAQKMVFASDVDGVFTADPKTSHDAKLIKLIDSKNLEKVLSSLEEAKTQDVTGGMKGKITELLEEAKNAPIVLVNGRKWKRVRSALLGEKVKGTLVRL